METESKSEMIKELPIEIKEIIKNTDFPVSRNEIIEREKKRAAIGDILRILGMLPDKEFNSAEDLAEELHRIFVGVLA